MIKMYSKMTRWLIYNKHKSISKSNHVYVTYLYRLYIEQVRVGMKVTTSGHTSVFAGPRSHQTHIALERFTTMSL